MLATWFAIAAATFGGQTHCYVDTTIQPNVKPIVQILSGPTPTSDRCSVLLDRHEWRTWRRHPIRTCSALVWAYGRIATQAPQELGYRYAGCRRWNNSR